MTQWRFAGATDTGLVRQSNQDAVYVDDSLALVADGMGGHAAGEVASAIAIEMIRLGFSSRPTVEGLYNAINEANLAVLADARENPEHFGMGTTVIAVGLTRDSEGVTSPTLFHVGDSRAYQLRDGALRQLSEDHSVAEEWVRMGRLTPEEAAVHPRRHQLTRAVGVEDTIAIDVVSIHAQPGDRLLLCSDGLSNELDNDTLARLASAPFGLDEAVDQLIESAKAAGGHDNISVVLVEFDSVKVTATPISRTLSTKPAEAAPPTATGAARPARRRIVTWRLVAAILVLAGVVGGFFAILHWYAYSTYYLGNDNGTVAVYRGQPSGVLWYKPTLVEDTTVKLVGLRPSDRQLVVATISEPTVQEALKHISALHTAYCLGASCATTTTVHATTTTAKKG